MVMILLETGCQLITEFVVSLCTMMATPSSCLSCSPLYHILCPSSVVASPKFNHLTSLIPNTFQEYLPISWQSSPNFPVAYSVLTFQVPTVMPLVGSLIFLVSRSSSLSPVEKCTSLIYHCQSGKETHLRFIYIEPIITK